MYIERNNEFDFNENVSIWSILSIYSSYSELDYLISKLEGIVYSANRLLNGNIREINNDDYYQIVKNLYNVVIFRKDIFNLLSEATNQKYSEIRELKTRVTYDIPVTEGHGRDFSWWIGTYQKVLYLFVPEGIEIDDDHDYSSDEINELLKKHKIFLFKVDSKEVNPNLPFESERNLDVKIPKLTIQVDRVHEYYSYGTSTSLDNIICSDEEVTRKMRKIALQHIRKNLYPKRVLKYMKEIMEYTEMFKNCFEKVINSSKCCDEREKEELLQRVGRLINAHDNNMLQLNKNACESSDNKSLVLIPKKNDCMKKSCK